MELVIGMDSKNVDKVNYRIVLPTTVWVRIVATKIGYRDN